MKNIKSIIWDFDGVILLSDEVRERGFEVIFRKHGAALVEQLLQYHRANGGLSRYVKIRYFYEQLLHQTINDDEVQVLADEFSEVMRQALVDKKLLNTEWLLLMEQIGSKYQHAIASGSDQKELRYLCEQLGIAHYFEVITGSPTPKNQLVANIIGKSNLPKEHFVLVGDAGNDRDAAMNNDILFYGYRNEGLKRADQAHYLNNLQDLEDALS